MKGVSLAAAVLMAVLFSVPLSAQQAGAANAGAGNAGPASAQQTPGGNMPYGNAEPRTAITAAEIADRISQAQAAAKAGTRYRGGPLLMSRPFRANLEYHTEADTSWAVHETAAELFVVLDGSGTLSMGGTLAGPITQRGTNLIAATAQGATAYKVAKGDMLLVPENTPHAVTGVDGALVLMTLHMPVPAATPGATTAEPAPAH